MKDFKLDKRIEWFCRNRINDFSPTISPAPKSATEIESIEEAVKYYVERGVMSLVAQKKYMGSYCSMYLHRELEKSYFVSRNGYLIQDREDLPWNMDDLLQAAAKVHEKIDWTGKELCIVGTELMPWGALGRGLIENEYRGYHDAVSTHVEALSRGFQLHPATCFAKVKFGTLRDKLFEVITSSEYLAYSNTPTVERKEKFKPHIIRQYDAALELFNILPNDSIVQGLEVFKKQIDVFGKEAELEFKPFVIHKIVKDDGSENTEFGNSVTYTALQRLSDNADCFHILSEKDLPAVYDWFNTLVNSDEEGIVIKPLTYYTKGLPPGFKIRNNNYLTMIYGVNFKRDYDYYLERRSIRRKLECSINDWEINHRLLKIPYSELGTENYLVRNLVYDRIQNEKVEDTLDTRL